MVVQSGQLLEGAATRATDMRLLVAVVQQMLVVGLLEGEGLAADRAGVGHLAGVQPLVLLQEVLGGEALCADVANPRLGLVWTGHWRRFLLFRSVSLCLCCCAVAPAFLCLYSHRPIGTRMVLFVVVSTRPLLVVPHVLKAVRVDDPQVHSQRPLHLERLVAEVAGKGLGVGGGG